MGEITRFKASWFIGGERMQAERQYQPGECFHHQSRDAQYNIASIRLKLVVISLAATAEIKLPSTGSILIINSRSAAHWCSWLTRCPLKAEITGSSPVCAASPPQQ